MFGCVLLLFLLTQGKVSGLQENQTCVEGTITCHNQTCVEGARTCHSNATCVNYERGYCCECIVPYIGDGYQCIPPPQDGNKISTWMLIGDSFNKSEWVLANALEGRISMTIPSNISLNLRFPLLFSGSLETIGWIFSLMKGPRALNGFVYTGGICNISSKIEFQNGEVATTLMKLSGFDDCGQLRMEIEVEGSVPDIKHDEVISLDDYTAIYYWVAHGMIESFSTRTYRLNNDTYYYYNMSQRIMFWECEFRPGRQTGYSVSATLDSFHESETTLYMVSQIRVLTGLELCRERLRICDSNADCIPELNTYRCECMKGYVGDGKTCVATIKSETKQRSAILSTYETTTQVPSINFRKDLVFLVDGSADMSNHFQQILHFMEDLSKDSGTDNGQLRVGLVIFGLNANVEFFLDNFTTQQEVVFAIRRIEFPPSANSNSRNIAAALRIARLIMFAEKHGGRVNVPDETILITSGKSNVEANKTQEEAVKAKSSGIHIITIGLNISSTETVKEITSIASGPNNTFIGQNPNTFTKTIREIVYRDVHIVEKENGSNIVMIACTVVVPVFVVSVIVGLVCFYKRFRKIHKIDDGEIINAMKYTVTENGILSDDGLKFIASKLDAEWELLAIEMGFERSTVDQIKISLPCRGGDNMILAFLKVWRWRNFRKDKNNENLIRVLFDSLAKWEKNNIIADICNKYGVSYKGYNTRRKPNDIQLQETETSL